MDHTAVAPVTTRLIAQFPGEYCRRRLVAINYKLDVSLIGGLSGVGVIEGCGDVVRDVAVGVDATGAIPVVQHHQDELQSVLLVDDIPIEKATEGKRGRMPHLNVILPCRCDNGIEARNAV